MYISARCPICYMYMPARCPVCKMFMLAKYPVSQLLSAKCLWLACHSGFIIQLYTNAFSVGVSFLFRLCFGVCPVSSNCLSCSPPYSYRFSLFIPPSSFLPIPPSPFLFLHCQSPNSIPLIYSLLAFLSLIYIFH